MVEEVRLCINTPQMTPIGTMTHQLIQNLQLQAVVEGVGSIVVVNMEKLIIMVEIVEGMLQPVAGPKMKKRHTQEVDKEKGVLLDVKGQMVNTEFRRLVNGTRVLVDHHLRLAWSPHQTVTGNGDPALVQLLQLNTTLKNNEFAVIEDRR